MSKIWSGKKHSIASTEKGILLGIDRAASVVTAEQRYRPGFALCLQSTLGFHLRLIWCLIATHAIARKLDAMVNGWCDMSCLNLSGEAYNAVHDLLVARLMWSGVMHHFSCSLLLCALTAEVARVSPEGSIARV